MAQRRGSSGSEVSLFPFLSILACLIGALVLIIVVLVIAQAGKAEGRTPDEIKMAQDFQRLTKEIEERKKLDIVLKEKLAELEKLQQDLEEKQQRYLKLRKLLDSSKEVQEQNMQIAKSLQKELDDLLTEIDGLKKEQEESKKTITELMAEIKKRQIPEDKKVPPVVVQPAGSGMPETTKVYFVECGTALKIMNAWGEGDYSLSSKAEVVVADVAYNHFLSEVAKDKNSLILFLIRDDGQGAFNNGAGRAEADYNIRIGKLPIPGRGVLDLALFDKFRGKVPPPPKAAPAPAPDKPKS
jgi:flagellar motor protein MotB